MNAISALIGFAGFIFSLSLLLYLKIKAIR